jgi:hypothetical protein
MMACKLGVTATRKGLTLKQKDRFLDVIKELNPHEFHDGDCIGGDEQAHHMVRDNFELCYMIGHPPDNDKQRAHMQYDRAHPTKGYIERNHEIVDMVDRMVAMPDGKVEKKRSGTWATIRYCRTRGRKLTIIYPDGTVGE